MENTFTTTLPLESLKYILSQFQTRKRAASQLAQRDRKIIVTGVSRAHSNPRSRRELYIRLQSTDHQPGHVGKWLLALYGTQPTRGTSFSTTLQFIKGKTWCIIAMLILPS